MVAAVLAPAGDWRDAAAYDWLPGAERPAFAWEWLRRDAAYCAAWSAGHAASDGFGLLAFENPVLGVPNARPLWRAAVDSTVLRADAVTTQCTRSADAVDFARFEGLMTVVAGARGEGAREHLLLSDGQRSLRIDILSGTVGAGPVSLKWRLGGLESTIPQLRALHRLIRLHRAGGFDGSTWRKERRAARWILQLRVHDALTTGACYREIAGVLFAASAGPRWRLSAPDARLRVQRLAIAARLQANAGPAAWFQGKGA